MHTFKVLLTYSILLAITLSNAAAFSQSRVDSFFNAVMKCRQNKNPGLAVSVVKDGQVMFAKGYGVSDLSTGRHVTNRTMFGIASISKAFTATLMLKQLRDKKLSIYTKPGDILPEGFAYYDTEFTQYATIRDMMTHCLGVPSNQMMRLDKNLTRKDIARRIQYFKPVYKFRLHYLYNNMHYGLLSHISEVLGGKDWEDLIQDNIYTPLGMHDSDFLIRADRKLKDVAQGYADNNIDGGVIPVPEEVNKQFGVYGGSTGLMSSSTDIAKWMLMQLNGGKTQSGVVVINETDLAQTHTPQTAMRRATVEKYFTKPKAPFTVTESTYAMGWKNGVMKGYKILTHTGTTFGYSSQITLLPDVKLGIFTSMTGEDANYILRTVMHSFLVDIFLNEEPTINETTVCTYPEPWFPAPHVNGRIHFDKTTPTRLPLSNYTGVYNHIAYGNLVVNINTTVSHLQMDYGIGSWILYPEHTHDMFSAEAFGLLHGLVNMKHIQFHITTHSPIKVEIPDFEAQEPPVFVKIHDIKQSGSASIVG